MKDFWRYKIVFNMHIKILRSIELLTRYSTLFLKIASITQLINCKLERENLTAMRCISLALEI